MKKMYKNGAPTPAGISNFYGKVDSFLDAALPGRQGRQDRRAERTDLRQAVRQENALKKIESKRIGSNSWLWFFVGFLFKFIGAIAFYIYLIYSKKSEVQPVGGDQ